MRKKSLAKTLVFLVTLTAVSLLAYANSSFDTAQDKLSKALNHWSTITPGGKLNKFDLLELYDQEDLNKAANEAIDAFLDSADTGNPEEFNREDMRTLDGATILTEKTLSKRDWKKGIEAAKQEGRAKNIERALAYGKRTTQKQNTEATPSPSPTTSSSHSEESHIPPSKPAISLDGKLDKLSAELLNLDHDIDYWKVRTADLRIQYDQTFINEIIGVDHTPEDVIQTFAKRIAKASSDKKADEDFSKLYAELMMLHVYLNPENGLGVITLGLPTDMAPINNALHRGMSSNLTGAPAISAEAHLKLLPQYIEQKDLISGLFTALDGILKEHAQEMLTLDNTDSAVQVTLATTVILHDFYKYSSLQGTVRTRAKKLFDVSDLWGVKTCKYYLESRYIRFEERQDLCEEFILGKDKPSNALEKAIQTHIHDRKGKELDGKVVARQYTFAVQALRTMAGKAVINWTVYKR